MTPERFVTVLDQFSRGPQPVRHFYVWYGELTKPVLRLQGLDTKNLDLSKIAADMPRRPYAQSEAVSLLRDALRRQLSNWSASQADRPRVLLVSGCELLARYETGLQLFYDVLTDRSMIILVCSPEDATYQPATGLPSYVSYRPATTIQYLTRLIGNDNVVAAQ